MHGLPLASPLLKHTPRRQAARGEKADLDEHTLYMTLEHFPGYIAFLDTSVSCVKVWKKNDSNGT